MVVRRPLQSNLSSLTCRPGHLPLLPGPEALQHRHQPVLRPQVQNLKFAELEYGTDVALSYLPQSHMAGMMLDQFICMANGSLCCFADKNAITKGKVVLTAFQSTTLLPRNFAGEHSVL